VTPDDRHFATLVAAKFDGRTCAQVADEAPAFTAEHVLPLGIGKLAAASLAGDTDRGFFDEPRTVAHLMGLVMTELAEVIEHDRRGTAFEPSEKIPEFTNEEEEVADAILRLLTFAAHRGLRVGAAVLAKHAYNGTRDRLHGKRY
jgi:NTP pyrophosphatase (non-canonical NTP hydrolase)